MYYSISKSFQILCIYFFTVFSYASLPAHAGHMAQVNEMEIWYETFGDPQNESLLLVMGGLCQGILWPTEFCEGLAKEGLHVIRYDHRDAGFSTCFDFEKDPYDLLDMAKDAIGLLNILKIEKTHILGLSMGGPIAELMAVHYPKRVLTISLMATSPDFSPLNRAFSKLPPLDNALSSPSKDYLISMEAFLQCPPQSETEKLDERVAIWNLLNGSIIPLEQTSLRKLQHEFLLRVRHEESLPNHMLAIKKSEEQISQVVSKVKVPTLVIQGSEDPIFQPDHGAALSNAIPGSKFLLLEGLGHIPNPYFFELLIKELKIHFQNHNKKHYEQSNL